MATKKQMIERTILSVLAVLFFVPLVYSFLFPGYIVGGVSGSHTGFVTAVEHNSNFIWESTLVYFKTDKASTQEDVYCVNDDNLRTLLMDASKENMQVTISYENDFILWKWECNGGWSVITAVE